MSVDAPNLLNSEFKNHIAATLVEPPCDYWEPAKQGISYFFDTFLKRNWIVILVLVGIIGFLFYRYRLVQMEKKKQAMIDWMKMNAAFRDREKQKHV